MARAFGYELAIDVPVPPEAVWAVIADYERDPSWREGVAMRSEPRGLVREGTRTFEDLRFLGETHRRVARIEGVEPGRAFRFVGEDGSFEGSRRVERTPDGARLRVTLRVAVHGVLALFAPLLGWVFRRRVQRDLARLRAVLTSRETSREASLPQTAEGCTLVQ